MALSKSLSYTVFSAGVRAVLVSWLLIVRMVAKANTEGDALSALKKSLIDPSGVLESWDNSLVNPCTWFHITCDATNSVTRVDLGNANLSGTLVPDLGNLPHLQYLELLNNDISGTIPAELGKLSQLTSMDLYKNRLSGPIPDSFGQLRSLRFLRMNHNSLTGTIPVDLTTISSLLVVSLSYNNLTGVVPRFANTVTTFFEDNPYLTVEN